MSSSSLSEQVVDRKKGRIISPLVSGLEDILKLNSWSFERAPEYLWLALILEKYGRNVGLNHCYKIIDYIIKTFPDIHSVRMSAILNSNEALQVQIFEKVKNIVGVEVLSPLTAVIDNELSKSFYNEFYIPGCSLGDRLEKLKKVTKKYNSPHSYEAADVRYLAILPIALSGKMIFCEGSPVVEALTNYPTTPHDAEIMRIYRPTIRSLEGVEMPDDSIDEFVNAFWERVVNMTDCNPMAICFEKDNKVDYKEFIENTKEILNYMNVSGKNELVYDEAYSVLFGSLSYAFKTFIEVIEHDLGNTIIGRQSARIIIEVYIMMKYLCLKEDEMPDIWAKYKAYGIGKYKLILLKLREGMGSDVSHVVEPLVDAIVNEPLLEEFTEIDLKYFDKQAIREKAISVGEKDLYDVAYDYDSSYAHGLWGAVRESSMLSCDNVFHHFHAIPDATDAQNLTGVTADCYKYLLKIVSFVNQKYNLPKWYMDILEESQND